MNDGGFPPGAWGPGVWRFMHAAALTYTPRRRRSFETFFRALGMVLPCGGCRLGYAKLAMTGDTKLGPETFASDVALFAWTVHVHNAVNGRAGKPVRPWQHWYTFYMKHRHGGNFAPTFWGPGMWRFIHVVAMTYPMRPTAQHRKAYFAFFRSLKGVLPCEACREEYSKMVRGLTPEVFSDQRALFQWTVAAHDAVNRRTGKPVSKSWEAWYRHYDRLRS